MTEPQSGPWMVVRYTKKKWGIGRSGGPAQLMVSPPPGWDFDKHDETLVAAMVDGLNRMVAEEESGDA